MHVVCDSLLKVRLYSIMHADKVYNYDITCIINTVFLTIIMMTHFEFGKTLILKTTLQTDSINTLFKF